MGESGDTILINDAGGSRHAADNPPRKSGDTIPIWPAVAPLNAPPRIQPQGRQPGCFVVPTGRDFLR